jgi:hypothetical protein
MLCLRESESEYVCGVCVCVCMCVCMCMYVCVCVHLCVQIYLDVEALSHELKELGADVDTNDAFKALRDKVRVSELVCVCVCVCLRDGERESEIVLVSPPLSCIPVCSSGLAYDNETRPLAHCSHSLSCPPLTICRLRRSVKSTQSRCQRVTYEDDDLLALSLPRSQNLSHSLALSLPPPLSLEA